MCDTYKVRTIVGTATSRFRVGQDAAKEMKDLWYTGSHYDWCQHPLPERERFIIADVKEMRGGAMRGGGIAANTWRQKGGTSQTEVGDLRTKACIGSGWRRGAFARDDVR